MIVSFICALFIKEDLKRLNFKLKNKEKVVNVKEAKDDYCVNNTNDDDFQRKNSSS